METKIIKVNPKELKLLELNARFMKANEFKKLVSNVKRDGCLTQLPFCVYDKEHKLEVLSVIIEFKQLSKQGSKR